ncbi:MAG: DUF480 domain-containing protein [Planctomycetota bacterium]
MTEEPKNTIRQLTRQQRRVLGTLMEKGFTTPDQYPMTLKGATTGCNQKSNRDPITEYSEAEVADALEELRELGLVAEVFTDGGRTARYRHYMRLRFDFSEAQHAILCELLLRGRQQPGELRTRASRMIRIDSQEHLKTELQGLADKGFLQASDQLDRRGVEVDHTFYLPGEHMQLKMQAPGGDAVVTDSSRQQPAAPAVAPSSHGSAPAVAQAVVQELLGQQATLQGHLERLQNAVDSIRQRLDRIERELGIG